MCNVKHVQRRHATAGTLHFRDQPTVQFGALEALVLYYTRHPYAKDSSGASHYLRAPEAGKVCHAFMSPHATDALQTKRKPKFF